MKKFFLSLMLVLLVSACGAKEEIYPPSAIQAGVDRCEHCNMLVPDDANATQLLLSDGRSLKFDDIGCMVEWVEEHGLDKVNVRYVRDFHSLDWVVMQEASFVYHEGFRTPMAYGIYSFSSLEDAETFVAEHGKGEILSYEGLEAHHWERSVEEGHHHHHHGEGDDEEEHGDESHGHGEKEEKKSGH